jgi:hypothetical protein
VAYRMHRSYGLIAALALVSAGAAAAADPQAGTSPDPTPAVREQMAAVHRQMAACLMSDRPLAECRAEMWKSCHDMMGASGCPMMNSVGGGMGPGMMGGGYGRGPGMMQGGGGPQRSGQ